MYVVLGLVLLDQSCESVEGSINPELTGVTCTLPPLCGFWLVHQLVKMAISMYFAYRNKKRKKWDQLSICHPDSPGWSDGLQHSPLRGARPTACSLVTIHVLVINFPFINQHNHFMWLISQLIFSVPNFFKVCGQCCVSSYLLFPYLENSREYIGVNRWIASEM